MLVLAEGDFLVACVVLIEIQVHHGDDERAAVVEHGAEGIIIGGGAWWWQGYLLIFHGLIPFCNYRDILP